ncbi:hypothetical protein NIES267_62610 [Calothrix parasitica NIES-267]|uniref:Uncharacterized protein n=1 Tax=Calothrix parasitica NIES-267 TaxID=1973488 RepID=A0A1Z4LZX0_9CYAN|nr:hypothetical protein NIES267_62610 [Calothrix parasitica NIES-267]
MKETYRPNLMTERLESLKAGIISSLSFSLVFTVASILNRFLLKKYFPELDNASIIAANWHWFISFGIAGFSGLLFGVTYRYIIREDNNPQLKSGSVLAFGLVRGLAQVDIGLNYSFSVLPLVVIVSESILEFAIAAFILDSAIKFSWVKPFIGE